MATTEEQALKLALDLGEALEGASNDLIEGVQRHADNISSIYRGIVACIDAHEAGHDEIAWSTVRKLMEITKTLELELLAHITEMKQA